MTEAKEEYISRYDAVMAIKEYLDEEDRLKCLYPNMRHNKWRAERILEDVEIKLVENVLITDNGERLMIERSCQFCYYEHFDENAFPCSVCICGIERKNMFQPKEFIIPLNMLKDLLEKRRSEKEAE